MPSLYGCINSAGRVGRMHYSRGGSNTKMKSQLNYRKKQRKDHHYYNYYAHSLCPNSLSKKRPLIKEKPTVEINVAHPMWGGPALDSGFSLKQKCLWGSGFPILWVLIRNCLELIKCMINKVHRKYERIKWKMEYHAIVLLKYLIKFSNSSKVGIKHWA